jgi:hypothetical protein
MVVVINGTDGISTPDVVVDSIGTDTSTEVAIRTNGVERMRVDSAGRVYIARTTLLSGAASALQLNHNGGAQFGIALQNISTAQSNALTFVNSAASIVGSVVVTTTATSYVTSSDYRLKENVAPITDAASRLLALNPVRFNFIADPDTTVDGFLAHEAQAVVPEAVTGEKDGEEMQAIDQSKLVPLLTAALQDALKTIQALEARVAALETSA